MIYFDNAATTFPKPPRVIKAVEFAMLNGVNIGRGSYSAAARAGDIVYGAREEVATQFGAEPENVIFTKNCTEALNMAIKGVVLNEKTPPHVITTNLEHNSVLRPLERLKTDGKCTYSVAEVSENEEETIFSIFEKVRSNTHLIIATNASNAFGNILPIKEIGRKAREKGIYFIVDCAQTAGSLPITLKDYNADILCMAGHKGLFGPMGTGLMIIREDLKLKTISEGGTGSYSFLLSPPEISPDRYETGTLNFPGIAGLLEGLRFSYANREEAYKKEMNLIRYIYEKLKGVPVDIYAPYPENYKQMPLLSFNVKGKDSSIMGEALGKEGIAVRTGFHCAYLAHKAHSTEERGTVRISLCRNNTKKEAEEFIYTLKKLLNKI